MDITKTAPYTYLDYPRWPKDSRPESHPPSPYLYPAAVRGSILITLEAMAAICERDAAGGAYQLIPFYAATNCPRGLISGGNISFMEWSAPIYYTLRAPAEDSEGRTTVGCLEEGIASEYWATFYTAPVSTVDGGYYGTSQNAVHWSLFASAGTPVRYIKRAAFYAWNTTLSEIYLSGRTYYTANSTTGYRVVLSCAEGDYPGFGSMQGYPLYPQTLIDAAGFTPHYPWLQFAGEATAERNPDHTKFIHARLDRHFVRRVIKRFGLLDQTVRAYNAPTQIYTTPEAFTTAPAGSVGYMGLFVEGGKRCTTKTWSWGSDNVQLPEFTPESLLASLRGGSSWVSNDAYLAWVQIATHGEARQWTGDGSCYGDAGAELMVTRSCMCFKSSLAAPYYTTQARRVARIDVYAVIAEDMPFVRNRVWKDSASKLDYLAPIEALTAAARAIALPDYDEMVPNRWEASGGASTVLWEPNIRQPADETGYELARVKLTHLGSIIPANNPGAVPVLTYQPPAFTGDPLAIVQNAALYSRSISEATNRKTMRIEGNVSVAARVLSVFEVITYDFLHPQTKKDTP